MPEPTGSAPRLAGSRVWIRVFAMAIGLAVLIWIHLAQVRFIFDDAYIHFRIARNLADAGQPYFNLEDAIKSSSSSGWTILVGSLFKALAADIRVVAVFNGMVLGALGLAVGWFVRTAFPRGRYWVAVMAGLLSVAGAVSASTGQMETPFAMLLLTVGYTQLLRDRRNGFVLLGLAIGFRLESLIFALVALTAELIVNRRRVLPAAGLVGCGFLPFVIYDLAFFGTVLPQPVRAKAITYDLDLPHSLATSVQELPFGEFGFIWIGCSIALAVSFAIPLLRRPRTRENLVVAGFPLSGVGVLVAYLAVHAYVFPWYLPLYFIPFIFAASCIFMRPSPPLVLLAVLTLIPAGVLLIGKATAALGHQELSISSVTNARVNQYLEVGESLRTTCPGCNLLTTEIGGLGYSFEGEIIDAEGLVSPAALAFHPLSVPDERPSLTTGAIPPEFAEAAEPDLIVSYDIFARALMRSDALTGYRAWRCPVFTAKDESIRLQAPLWGINALWIWVADDLPQADEIGDRIEAHNRCRAA